MGTTPAVADTEMTHTGMVNSMAVFYYIALHAVLIHGVISFNLTVRNFDRVYCTNPDPLNHSTTPYITGSYSTPFGSIEFRTLT